MADDLVSGICNPAMRFVCIGSGMIIIQSSDPGE